MEKYIKFNTLLHITMLYNLKLKTKLLYNPVNTDELIISVHKVKLLKACSSTMGYKTQQV